MTVEEAIKTALQYEAKVKQVYAEALEQSTDPVGKRIFTVLADEEQSHLEFLSACLDEWKKTGAVTAKNLQSAIPPKKVISAGVRTLRKRMGGESHGAELQMLHKALDVEIETTEFYRNALKGLPADSQQLFARFVEIEQGHTAIVQAEIDAVSGLGFWFDLQEFNLEAE